MSMPMPVDCGSGGKPSNPVTAQQLEVPAQNAAPPVFETETWDWDECSYCGCLGHTIGVCPLNEDAVEENRE